MTLRLRPTLMLKLPDRKDFTASLIDGGGTTSIFLPGTTNLAPGMRVDLGVLFVEGPRVFSTRGIVRWKRESSGHVLPPGLAVELAEHDASTRELILTYVRGKNVELKDRRDRRLPIMHAVSFASGDFVTNEVTEDLSKSGAFLSSNNMLAPGTEIDIKLKPDGELFALRFYGEVVWNSKARGGIAVRFAFPNPHAKTRFEAFVDRLSEQVDQALEVHGPQGRL
ncbi:MAG: PilZ domain-containing protein [Myxococcota bacterium]